MMRRAVLRAHVWLLAFAVPVLVRVLPLRAALWVMAPPRWWRPYRGVPAEAIAETVRRRLARPRQMKRRACLREGLLVFHFLCLAGHEPILRFAVFPPEPAPRAVHAHCWVTLEGRPCSSPPQGPSAELMRYARPTGAQPAGQA